MNQTNRRKENGEGEINPSPFSFWFQVIVSKSAFNVETYREMSCKSDEVRLHRQVRSSQADRERRSNVCTNAYASNRVTPTRAAF